MIDVVNGGGENGRRNLQIGEHRLAAPINKQTRGKARKKKNSRQLHSFSKLQSWVKK